ncbi:hypothetical protein LTR84_000245 [Exophiala bonariae]|uniref:Peroxin 20 n=1 Tax=Exophiala bonariae TaxID=1690606 RepID=A0AAV9NST6_9EURO|nr:hypothetical protein LTR84_000245 [Exophiala bonariae]
MADALCGPSNPLQNLQKHTQVDRTLQQDRLVGARQQFNQSFRTADPRAGSLDADFHAFENGIPNQFQFQQPPEFANAFPTFRPTNQPNLNMNGWASEFQKLSMHEQPVPAQQFRQEAPLVRSMAGEWHTEFMRQRSSASTPISQGKQAVQQPQMNNFQMASPMSMGGLSQPTYGQFNGMYQGAAFQQHYQPPMATMEQQPQQTNAAMEAAFADAFSQLEKLDQEEKLKVTAAETPALQQQEDLIVPVESSKIGADSIQYREWKDRSVDQDTRDADELARTAGQLLTSVQHDTSDKFQNSNFLELMRRIRDREVEVQNNDLMNVSTGEAAAVHNGDTEPNGLFVNGTFTSSQIPGSSQQQHASNDNAAQNNASSSHFAFPDMDVVYAPAADDLEASTEERQQQQPPAYWATGQQHTHAPYTTYSFDEDQQQQQPLHPGGKYYPDQSPSLPRATPEMSGGISASDFDYVDESGNLARRFR